MPGRATAVATLCAAALVLVGGPAAASDRAAAAGVGSCGVHGAFSINGTTATCSYTAAGEDTFAVPAGTTTVRVHAVGAAGGSGGAEESAASGGTGPTETFPGSAVGVGAAPAT